MCGVESDLQIVPTLTPKTETIMDDLSMLVGTSITITYYKASLAFNILPNFEA